MTAYYNEKDRNAAAWLRHLIAEGHIAAGEVDERSIVDVRPDELDGFEQCHFFAGIGGWSLALRYAGINDQSPVWTGSCPCQPFSAAGQRKGFADDRHLWPEFRRLIAERRPATVFGEQVAGAADWLRLVRGDLEALDYAVGVMPIEAASAGADHLRDRFWFVAHGKEQRRSYWDGGPLQGAAELERPAQQLERRSSVNVPLADADKSQRRLGDEQPARQQSEQQSNPSSCDCRDVSDAENCSNADQRRRNGSAGQHVGALAGASRGGDRGACAEGDFKAATGNAEAPRVSDFEWVIGADQKIRRVKPGVRLLVDGLPHRVGLLRGFGNAIDPRPAAAFITAATN